MKIYCLCLSNREKSINKAFLSTLAKEINAELIPFEETDLPMMKEPSCKPEKLEALSDKLKSADGIIISSPEYNGTMTPFGKNLLDWISTIGGGSLFKNTAFKGKPIFITTVAPGPLGGIRAVPDLVKIITELGGHVVNTFSTVGGFTEAEKYDYSNAFIIAENFVSTVKKYNSKEQ